MSTGERVRCLFGTDGVRDVANRGIMTPEMALNLGRSFVLFLIERGVPKPRILVGKDTRRSGALIESAMVSGMMSAGANVFLAGILPTPGVSYLLRGGGFDAGAVISASHNPAEYNGIKFFDARGAKLSDDDEASVEEYLGDDLVEEWRPTGASIGETRDVRAAGGGYADWLRGELARVGPCDWPLAIDAANGAAAEIAPRVFADWRGGVSFCGVDYDGLNINEGVGVMHMAHLAKEVRAHGARLGFAYDGDADRVLLCDASGRTIDGDIMLWVVARFLRREGALGGGVVATVMSNLALEEKLAEEEIPVFRCPVGDRYVVAKMRETGAKLGGEQSGHIVASDYVATGDGICTGILFLRACLALGLDPDGLVDAFPRYPQVLRNLKLANREDILASPRLKEACACAEAKLGGAGRLFLRPSGTEPLLRILVEARDEKLMHAVCGEIEEVILAIGGDANR